MNIEYPYKNSESKVTAYRTYKRANIDINTIIRPVPKSVLKSRSASKSANRKIDIFLKFILCNQKFYQA